MWPAVVAERPKAQLDEQVLAATMKTCSLLTPLESTSPWLSTVIPVPVFVSFSVVAAIDVFVYDVPAVRQFDVALVAGVGATPAILVILADAAVTFRIVHCVRM